jgi:uncharacterized protein YdaU (DUF1376 family)
MKPSSKKPADAIRVWMPWYIGDYLRDTLHLSPQERDALSLLMMGYWSLQAPLPDIDSRLGTMARVGPETWDQLRPSLEPFFVIEGGLWRHEHLDAEITKALENFEAQQNRTQKATAARLARQAQARDVQRNVARDVAHDEHTRAGEGDGEGPYREKGSDTYSVGETDPSWESAA